MKKHFNFKSVYRAALVALCLLTVGVGEMWGNTTHPIYCAIKSSSLGSGTLKINVHKGSSKDGDVWFRTTMEKMPTTIHKAATGETKDLYYGMIEYVEEGLQEIQFEIWDGDDKREWHSAFSGWWTSDGYTKPVYDYENKNFTTYPASLAEKKSYVYFDAADWNDDVKQLVISHGTYRGFNNLNHLSNTTLYYANPDLNWGDAVCISFIGNSTSWSESVKWLNDIPLWSYHYTGYLHYSLSENSFNYFARRSGDENGAALSYNYWGTESTAYQNLNKTQTVQARVKATGSSYSDVSFSSWPGSVSAERTYMSSATATTSPSAANMTSATTDAVLTSSITLTASANSGYYFEGWGDASDSNPTDGTTAKTYSVTDTKTSYAFFSQTYTLTYDRKGDYSTSTLSVYSVDNFSGSTSSGSSIPTGHLITLVATPATGYKVEGWYSDADCTSPYTNGSGGVTIEGENTFKLASLNANTEVYCKFRPITYTVTLEGMEADGESLPISVNVTYDAVLPSLETKHTKAHYDLLGYWAASDDHGMNKTEQLIEANGNWIPDVTGYTGKDGAGHPTWVHDFNISLFAKWEEHPYTIDLVVDPVGAGTIDKGPTIEAYYVTASDEITATASTGYSFREWDFSKTDGVNDVYSADGYTSTSNPIRVLAQHDGTLTAKFTANNYTVGLDNREADPEHGGTASVNVTYDATTGLTSAITPPQKEHYTFGGYFTEVGGAGTQLIKADGSWIAGVSGYTSASKQWIYAGDITLYAKWDEDLHDVTIAVFPAGAGNVQVSGETVTKVTAGYATHSPEMTAVPANAAWVFKEWQVTSNAPLDLEDYSTTGTTMKITATDDDQTLTAFFEPRFYLVGGEITGTGDDGSGTESGMPGWDNYNEPFEIVTNSPILATCSLTLGSNKNFYIMVRDKTDGLSYGKSSSTLGDESIAEPITFTDQDNKVLFYSNGGTNYTFKITAVDGSGRPTVSVERPYQVNIGRKRVDIDGNDHDDNTGGTVDLSKQTAPDTWTPISNGDWVPYGISVKYNASKEDGYTLDWYTESDYATQFSTVPYWFHTATSTGNGYAKFTEIPTTVTLSNGGHGHVEINDEIVSSTTVGITTHRELTAVPDEGYKFNSWTIVSGSDIALSSTSTNPTTLSGLGAGAVSGQEVLANFDYRWTLKAESEGWGQNEFIIENISTNASGDVVGYVDISLSANTNYQFTMYDKQESQTYKNGTDNVYYMTNGNSHNWSFATDKTYNCGITTAGAGVYRFTWNITDKKMTVTYPNFIIYRTGDKDGDKRATEDDVESYAGGTISEAIEFRMRVNRLDYWYTLCLPFKVNAVKVWDEEDGQYYDIVPYWRTGGKYYTGHYIIRTPVSTADFAIENFDSRERWTDPSSPDRYLPSKNTPYIIQWHDGYFSGKYISFFGPTGESIPTSMNQGANTSSDEKVNIYGNDCMTSGTVRDAYMLDSDYGSGGAWLRAEVGTDRTVLPFECFIRANATTTAKYRVLRRDMADDTPTGLDTLSMTEDTVSKVLIDNRIYIIRGGKIYTIQGTFVKEVE